MTPTAFLLARLDERLAALAAENCDCEGETGPCCARQVQADIQAMRKIVAANPPQRVRLPGDGLSTQDVVFSRGRMYLQREYEQGIERPLTAEEIETHLGPVEHSPTVRALAAAYDWHPEWQEAWRV